MRAGTGVDTVYVVLTGSVGSSGTTLRLKKGESFPPMEAFLRDGACICCVHVALKGVRTVTGVEVVRCVVVPPLFDIVLLLSLGL